MEQSDLPSPQHDSVSTKMLPLVIGNRRFYLVGTAHVSKTSVDLVQETIAAVKPDTICVELCSARYEAMKDPDAWQQTDLFKVVRDGKAYVLMAQLALASFQKRIGDQLNIKPGDEMRQALKSASEINAQISLIDRDVKTTLRRAWHRAKIRSLFRVFFSLFGSFFTANKISAEEIDQLKEGDGLKDIMTEFANVLPDIKQTLIDERDQYMATKLLQTTGNSVVAVVGAAHVPGIQAFLGQHADLTELERVPPSSMLFKSIAWGFPLLVFGLILYGFITAGLATSGKMIEAWILINGISAFIGVLFALPHPLTAITAFIAAPFTSLNPTIAAGWVCGLVQAFVSKPRVKDLETITDDITTIRGLWTNRVTKVLLVMAFANIGSSIGTLIGIGKIASLLK